ncbi:hypothetical protein D4R49_00585 [bacterium]|nr:MAG: hypothetical protein D4R49_00585 [bacterium]
MLERASSAERGSDRLAERRRLRHRRGITVFSILLLLLLGALIWGLWQTPVRISSVTIYGADVSFTDYATRAMQGSYFGIIPRDSIFFFPESNIRADILAAHPDIAAVSIFRKGFTGISLKMDYRVPIARWCGVFNAGRSDLPALNANCYVFDANGTIFAAAATSTETINMFSLYAPLEGDGLEPLHSTIAHAERLPLVFDFARQLDTLGSRISHVVLRDDEVDDYLTSGTRITYVLGHERDAFTALVSARDNLKLADGSLEYVDLRFDGKVYLKKKQ